MPPMGWSAGFLGAGSTSGHDEVAEHCRVQGQRIGAIGPSSGYQRSRAASDHLRSRRPASATEQEGAAYCFGPHYLDHAAWRSRWCLKVEPIRFAILESLRMWLSPRSGALRGTAGFSSA